MKKNRYGLIFFLLVLVAGIAYTACKNITPEQEHISKNIELKLSK